MGRGSSMVIREGLYFVTQVRGIDEMEASGFQHKIS
jgi:hypothetical protein